MTAETPISPLDCSEYGGCLVHHGTVPAAVDPGGEFLQLLERLQDTAGYLVGEPSLLLLHVKPPDGSTALWFGREELDLACGLITACAGQPPEQWRNHLSTLACTATLFGITSGASNLGALLRAQVVAMSSNGRGPHP
jgi:hypothetical protein